MYHKLIPEVVVGAIAGAVVGAMAGVIVRVTLEAALWLDNQGPLLGLDPEGE